ncbi:hypothetical protein BC829DRAFT_413770 [Chytridium lagenaria]|nr:hypothetical protein BC829DRAFT_413770 [Chytridium lagenaria]
MSDELRLSVNDIIRIVQTFDDGWAMGQTATSTPGMFPLACTTPFTTLSAPSTPSHALIDDDERGRGARAPPPLRGRSISRRRSIEVFVEDGEVEVYDGDGEFEEEEEVVVVEEGRGSGFVAA